MEKKVTSHVIKGLVLFLVLVVFDLLGYFLDLKFEKWYGWITYAIMLGGIIYGCVLFSNQKNNNVTFGNVFAHGFKISLVLTCLLFVYTLISLNLLFPDMMDKILAKAMEEARKSGKEIPDEALAMMPKIIKITIYAGLVVVTLLIGVIGGLIGGAVAKKNPPTPFQPQQ